MQLILITGLSGSGKSVALNVLEDSGYYTCDNLPAKLLPEMVEFLRGAGYTRVARSASTRAAATRSVSCRGRSTDLKARGVDVRVLFLEAKADTLLKRFSETRRRHPLSDGDLTVAECIARERGTARRHRRHVAPHRHQRPQSRTRCAAGSRTSSNSIARD